MIIKKIKKIINFFRKFHVLSMATLSTSMIWLPIDMHVDFYLFLLYVLNATKLYIKHSNMLDNRKKINPQSAFRYCIKN